MASRGHESRAVLVPEQHSRPSYPLGCRHLVRAYDSSHKFELVNLGELHRQLQREQDVSAWSDGEVQVREHQGVRQPKQEHHNEVLGRSIKTLQKSTFTHRTNGLPFSTASSRSVRIKWVVGLSSGVDRVVEMLLSKSADQPLRRR